MKRQSKTAAGVMSSADRLLFVLKTLYAGNQSRLAADLGCSQAVISKIAAGKQQPGARLLQALAAHPKVNPAWVLTGEGEPLLAEAQRGELQGWPVPVATCLLPGPPAAHRDLLTARVEYVPGVIYRETIYAVEAAACQPAGADPAERMLPSDLVIIDADPNRWATNSQMLHNKLCAVRSESSPAGPILFKRVRRRESQIVARAEEQFTEKPTRDQDPEQSSNEFRRRALRSIELDTVEEIADRAERRNELCVVCVVGVALQLIRAL